MNVLVTGSNGFIGRHLFEALKKHPSVSNLTGVSRKAVPISADPASRFAIVACDLKEVSQVAQLLKRVEPDVVFHFAGNAVIKADDGNPCDITRSNVLATHHLIEYCKPGTRFVFASSAAVYGNNAVEWMSEESPIAPNSIYGATKVASEALVEAYTRLGRVNGLSLRLVANVGAGATHGVVKDVVAKLKSDDPLLRLLGDHPGSTKPYVHVSDTAAAAIFLGMNQEVRGVVNVCNASTITIEAVAKAVMEALGISKPIHWLGEGANWKGDNRFVYVRNDRARTLGWEPRFPRSEDAIAQAVKDMESASKLLKAA